MRSKIIWAAIAICGGVIPIWAVVRMNSGTEGERFQVAPGAFAARPEQASSGLCPWRNPEADLRRFFPAANETRDQTLILSGKRLKVASMLGREPTAEENAILIHQVLRSGERIGTIITRRVRGESGVIEIVLALGRDGKVVGSKIQRLRENEAVARELKSDIWLNSFRGKISSDAWRLGEDIPNISEKSRSSAEAILQECQVTLILFGVAGESGASTKLTHQKSH